ncbi:MAG: rhomboid family intramembrane serine protease [Myxococcota bacterium]
MTYGLIALTVLAFGYQITHADEIDPLVRAFGFVPARLTAAADRGDGSLPAVLLTMVTSTFLHGGWFHIIGNLLYLRVFGDNVEDRIGHVGFFLFYFASAAAGATAQAIIAPTSTTPMIGASGAIAGVLGAYIVMFPRARILTLFPIFILLTFIEVPAFFFLGIWALQQFLNGFLVVTSPAGGDGGIAWFAHIGGFALGVVVGGLARTVKRRR